MSVERTLDKTMQNIAAHTNKQIGIAEQLNLAKIKFLEDRYEMKVDELNMTRAGADKQIKKAEKRAYKQGWDSAGGELTDVKEQVEAVLDRLEESAVKYGGNNVMNAGSPNIAVPIEAVEAERKKLRGES
ncbi:hypothetical protein [Rhodococcus sp. NPDC004095]